MPIRVSLGATLNVGGYNSIKIEVESTHEDYGAAYDEARRLFYRTAYRHAREVTVGIKAPSIVDWLAGQTDEEPT